MPDTDADRSGIGHYRYEGFALEEKIAWMGQGGGPGALVEAQRALAAIGTDLIESEQTLRDQVTTLGGTWESPTGTTAGAAMLTAADQVGSRVGPWVDSVERTTCRMPGAAPRPEYGVRDAVTSQTGDLFDVQTDFDDRVARRRAADAAANRILYEHEAACRTSLAAMPALGLAPEITVGTEQPATTGPPGTPRNDMVDGEPDASPPPAPPGPGGAASAADRGEAEDDGEHTDWFDRDSDDVFRTDDTLVLKHSVIGDTPGEPAMTELSTVELEVCWERLGRGELPPILDSPSPGRTHEERRSIVEQVWDGLRARGLTYGTLADDLVILSGFTWAVDVRVVSTTLVRARGAVAAGYGVLAVQDGDRVVIRRVPEHRMVAELAALAGPGPVSRVESVRVRADALDTASALAGDDPHALAQGMITLGERPADAHAVARLCHDAHTRGQFVSRPGNVVVAFHDVPSARYLHLRRGGWVTFVPAGTTGLATHVRQLTAETAHR